MAQTILAETVVEEPSRVSSYVEWGPILAGAVVAGAISFVLVTFGSAIGLTAASPWPDSGAPAWVILLLATLWVLLVQAGSYALGGYLSGRLRAPVTTALDAEHRFRDGAHGLIVWGVGALVSAVVLAGAVGSVTKAGVDAVSTVASGTSQSSMPPTRMGYVIDRLVRNPNSTLAGTMEARGEIARVFAYSLDQGSLAKDDREYLGSLVAKRTGTSEPDGEKRVVDAYAQVQSAADEAREAADEARKAAMIAGFLVAASMLIAAAAASAGATMGGRHRDEGRTLRVFGREHFW